MAEKRTMYFLMVDHPLRGKIRVGHAYTTRESARDWRKFVRAAWNGLPVSVVPFTFRLTDGRLDKRAIQTLSTKFNMDPPEGMEVHNAR